MSSSLVILVSVENLVPRVLLIQLCQQIRPDRAGHRHQRADGNRPALHAAGDDRQGGADDDAQDEVVHEGVELLEQPGDQLGEEQDANNDAQRQGDDHAKVQLFDAAGHGLVEAQVNQEVGGAHARNNHAQADQCAAEQPVDEGRFESGFLDGLQPAHQEHGPDGHDAQQDEMPGLAALFPGGFEQRGEGAGDETDEQPGELRGVVREGEVDHGREAEDAQPDADYHGEEVADIFPEVHPKVAEEAHQGFVDAEDNQQNAAGQTGDDPANAGQGAFEQAEDPIADTPFGFNRVFCCGHKVMLLYCLLTRLLGYPIRYKLLRTRQPILSFL